MTVHPPEPGSGWDVTDHADTIRRDWQRHADMGRSRFMEVERSEVYEVLALLAERQQAIDALREAAGLLNRLDGEWFDPFPIPQEEVTAVIGRVNAALVKLGEKP